MHAAPKPLKAYPWYLRIFFWSQRRKFGAPLASALVWARVPRLFLAVAFFLTSLERRKSPLTPALRSLVMVRVSQINHCRFCVDANAALLHKRGVDWEKIGALENWRASERFEPVERAVLAYADAVTYTDGRVDDGLVAELKRHFDEDGLVELTGLVAFQNMSSKFNAALDIPPQGFCRTVLGGSSATHDNAPKDA